MDCISEQQNSDKLLTFHNLVIYYSVVLVSHYQTEQKNFL